MAWLSTGHHYTSCILKLDHLVLPSLKKEVVGKASAAGIRLMDGKIFGQFILNLPLS